MPDSRVSIVVITENMGRYLGQCLQSISDQTYDDVEFIVVDNGSTDSTSAICNEFAKDDLRFSVIRKHKDNRFMAYADALAASTGECILFVNGCDYITPFATETMYKELRKNEADVVFGQHVIVSDIGRIRDKKGNSLDTTIEAFDGYEAMKYVMSSEHDCTNILFKKSLLKNYLFPENGFEDEVSYLLHCFDKLERGVLIPTDTYYKREHLFGRFNDRHLFDESYINLYINAREDCKYIEERMVSLMPLAEARMLRALMYCYTGFKNLKKPNEQAITYRDELKAQIAANVGRAMQNPYVDNKLKTQMLISK